jgi:hypothetical protein
VVIRGIAGLRTIDTRRDTGEDEVEFWTILKFDDWAAVRAFAGADHTVPVLPPPPCDCCAATTPSHSTTTSSPTTGTLPLIATASKKS